MIKRLHAQERGAPAYMMQYSAVMMLLLSFFIAILSQATVVKQKGGFREGVGAVNDSFGLRGGLGLMPYVRGLSGKVPETTSAKKDGTVRALAGQRRDEARTGEDVRPEAVQVQPRRLGVGLKLETPIVFAEDTAALIPAAREYLDRLSGILQSMPDSVLTVSAYCRASGNMDHDRLLAAERSTAVVRYLKEQGRVPDNRLRAVSYTFDRYLRPLTPDQAVKQQAVTMVIYRPAGYPAAHTENAKEN